MTNTESSIQEGLYKNALRVLPYPNVILDNQGKIVFVSEAWERFGQENTPGKKNQLP